MGDYILAPQICIERKGISDMFQSFASGRLYAQAESMSRHYDLPALLLEFSPNRSFSLQAENEIPSEIQVERVIMSFFRFVGSTKECFIRSEMFALRSLCLLSPFQIFAFCGPGMCSSHRTGYPSHN